MRLQLTRDSVAMGDDVDAPHEASMELPDGTPLREAVAAVVVEGRYLALIAGGRASWILTGAGVGAGAAIAVVAQQWDEPRFLVPADLAPVSSDDGAVHWHFRYLAQRDPEDIYRELGAAPTA
ncbi:hypothetical protein [Kitasatospora sp. NPDC002040]|uniref:hypothetical protein n=1 Tax=Kitasatospora sp. NPDC002040 TaxID=3154661 RepID=UPI003328A984